MSRRTATLLVSGVLFVVLTAVAALLPVPYVALEPGPTTNTLGSVDGAPVIGVKGHRTYPVGGHLDLTTVAVFGGPGHRLDLVTALRGWLDRSVAVVPEETIYPPGESEQKVQQENKDLMSGSQENATAAALGRLGIPVTTNVVVDSVLEGSPAAGRLHAGDVVVAVDGTTVRTPAAVRRRVSDRKPGDTVHITVVRDGKRRTLTLGTRHAPHDTSRPVVGFVPRAGHTFPFSVKFGIRDIGGPSAGLMFSLGILDKLTPGRLTHGRYIAGTGTIDDSGKVGLIGGIQQKIAAARAAGATVFLTPAGNCADAVDAKPDGLRLVRVTSLDGAVKALHALGSGHGRVPSCTH